jgi:hypothetical protein
MEFFLLNRRSATMVRVNRPNILEATAPYRPYWGIRVYPATILTDKLYRDESTGYQ